jgi:membrane associated rhomboid family serine protease
MIEYYFKIVLSALPIIVIIFIVGWLLYNFPPPIVGRRI